MKIVRTMTTPPRNTHRIPNDLYTSTLYIEILHTIYYILFIIYILFLSVIVSKSTLEDQIQTVVLIATIGPLSDNALKVVMLHF
jgi:hypothetical protein